MSFALTTQQFKDKIKTVTRRFGWYFLKPGDVLWGVEKCMGFKKGEKIKRLGLIRIISAHKEVLSEITQEDCIKEGFPDMAPSEFVRMLCNHSKCAPNDTVNRIEFEYIQSIAAI
ncbi:MAG: ASCH domain-containing protein [Candidatus Omnitrophica bacterium]|nr:ASCH domain-containing protein [Candidatus Omnitrophota bacterium]